MLSKAASPIIDPHASSSELWKTLAITAEIGSVQDEDNKRAILEQIIQKKYPYRNWLSPSLSDAEKLALLDDALLFMYAEEVELVSIANTFMDAAMKVVFAAGAALNLPGLIPGAASLAVVTQLYGYLWNYIDTLGGVTDLAAAGPSQPGSNTAGKVWDKVDTTFNVSTTVFLGVGTALAHAGVAAAALLPGISFAACMWANLHSECKKLQDSQRKLDPHCLLADRIVQRDQAMSELQEVTQAIEDCYTYNKLRGLDGGLPQALMVYNQLATSDIIKLTPDARKKIAKLEKKRQKLIKQYCRFNQQAEILKHHVPIKPDDLDSEAKENLELQWLGRSIAVPLHIKQNEKLYDALLEKQKAIGTAGKLAIAAKSFASVGMTFLAITPLAGPAAPIVSGIGICLSLIAGILKIAELIYNNRAGNRKHIAADIKSILLKEYESKLNRDDIFPSTMTDPLQRLKYRLAYEALTERTAYQELSAQLKIQGNDDTEKKFYQHLLAQQGMFFSLGKSGAQKIVDQALENKIDDTILRKYYFKACQKKDTLKPIKDHLTPDDQKQLLKVACDQLAKDKKAMIATQSQFFKTEQNEKSSLLISNSQQIAIPSY